ncbi:hypothetical protein OAD38_01485 [Ascidiaceihabitans sp.]|nr:hypothetical protein [Ascidiaceihabitans sp.]
MSEFFEGLYSDYNFAVSEAKRLAEFEKDEDLSKRGKGQLSPSEVESPNARSKVRRHKRAKVGRLMRAISDLESANADLDLRYQIDEWVDSHKPENPVHWRSIVEACEAILEEFDSASTRGRPKNKPIAAALDCFLLHLSANEVPPSFYINAGKPSDRLLEADRFLRDAGYQGVQSYEALAEMLKQKVRR